MRALQDTLLSGNGLRGMIKMKVITGQTNWQILLQKEIRIFEPSPEHSDNS